MQTKLTREWSSGVTMDWETSGEENEANKQDRNREADWLRRLTRLIAIRCAQRGVQQYKRATPQWVGFYLGL